jgi:hypothetical protein
MSCVEKQKSPDNKMTGSKVGIGPQLYLVNLQCGFHFLLEVFFYLIHVHGCLPTKCRCGMHAELPVMQRFLLVDPFAFTWMCVHWCPLLLMQFRDC